jgi:acetyl esterase/lipase
MTVDHREVLTRKAPGPDFTVRYGSHPDHVADVRMPPGDVTGPLVIFVHGGFWRAAYDRAHAAPLAVDLAGRGYPAVTIEYRRVGRSGGGWPGTFNDVAAAVARVPDLIGAELRARGRDVPDLDRPLLAGHSAGGHLALWLATQPETAAGVRGVVALAPVADLGLAHRLWLDDGAVALLLGGGPDDVPDRYAAADPARLLPSKVPTVVVHGTEDDVVPVQMARTYVAAARAAGDRTTLTEVVGAEHYALIDPLSAAWPTVLRALGAFRDERSVDAD